VPRHDIVIFVHNGMSSTIAALAECAARVYDEVSQNSAMEPHSELLQKPPPETPPDVD